MADVIVKATDPAAKAVHDLIRVASVRSSNASLSASSATKIVAKMVAKDGSKSRTDKNVKNVESEEFQRFDELVPGSFVLKLF